MAANPWCPARRREWIATETEMLPCSWHHLADEDLLTVWPAEYRQWALDRGLLDEVRQVRDVREVRQVQQARTAPLRISSPPDGATYLVDPTLRSEFQALSLRAVKPAPGTIEWIVDGRSLGSVASDQAVRWPLVPGRHSFVVRDTDGRAAKATIVVR
jgi:membrane carboxypeptidase/penicillin-binding protein PbpC